jgi:hypothetical protein
MRFIQDNFHLDFGDDDNLSNIWWSATVTIDTRYMTIHSYTINGVHACGKIFKWNDTPTDIKERIVVRMKNMELEEFAP